MRNPINVQCDNCVCVYSINDDTVYLCNCEASSSYKLQVSEQDNCVEFLQYMKMNIQYQKKKMKKKHDCFKYYRNIGKRRFICDKCGKIIVATKKRR